MSINNIVIREIKQEDNAQIEQIIRAVFPEFKMPLTGTAFEDEETKSMFESYQNNNEVYFILESDDKVLGGAGIKPLKGFESDVCELQKMYFSPSARGNGYGKLMIDKCLQSAKALGYKKCYLESASQLKAAIHIYEKKGFKYLDGPLGDTGHFSCGVWMLKDLV